MHASITAPRRRLLGAAALGLAAPAWAQTGGRTIRILVPYAGGSLNDILARLIAPQLQARSGLPVVVDNRTGASGTIAMEQVARAAPDGLTLALAASSDLTSIRFLRRDLPYDVGRAFAPIALVAVAHNVLAAPVSLPPRTFPELIAWLRANPGRNYASGAVGSNAHMGMVELGRRAGFNAEHILYRNGLVQALIQGEVDMSLYHELAARPFVQSGQLKVFGVASPARMPNMPEIPTIAEQGFPGYAFQSFFALVAPAGTPAEVLGRLNQEVRAVIEPAEARASFLARGVEIVGGPPEVLTARIENDTANFGQVIRLAGIAPE